MAEPFLGELRLFPIGYAPQGWAYCEGQTLTINQNQALYALLGTTYGGDGVTTFNLPDLRGRVPIHFNGAYQRGAAGGQAEHTLTVSEMPMHNHRVEASTSYATAIEPTGQVWASNSVPSYTNAGTKVTMHAQSITSVGGNQPHNNMQPYQGVQFCIALQGIFPSHN